MNKKTRKKFIITSIVAAILAILAAIIFIFLRKSTVEQVIEIGSIMADDGENAAEQDRGYASETSYSGSSFVPGSLFDYQFKKTDNYIPNKDYINVIGAEEAKALSDRVLAAVSDIYGINYETLDKETYKGFIEEYLSYGMVLLNKSTGEMYEGTDEISDFLYEKIMEDELIIETQAYSDKCMVFYDEGSDIVRAKVTFVVYNCKDIEGLEAFLGVDAIEIGKPFSIILDIYMTADMNIEDRSSFVVQRTEKIS